MKAAFSRSFYLSLSHLNIYWCFAANLSHLVAASNSSHWDRDSSAHASPLSFLLSHFQFTLCGAKKEKQLITIKCYKYIQINIFGIYFVSFFLCFVDCWKFERIRFSVLIPWTAMIREIFFAEIIFLEVTMTTSSLSSTTMVTTKTHYKVAQHSISGPLRQRLKTIVA